MNVVDPFVRKGYRFKGVASILDSGPLYDNVVAFYKQRGVASVIREVVLVRVRSARAQIDSPAYDLGATEDEVHAKWESYWQSFRLKSWGPSPIVAIAVPPTTATAADSVRRGFLLARLVEQGH